MSCSFSLVGNHGWCEWTALLVERKQSESCDPVGSERIFGQACRLLPLAIGAARKIERRGTPKTLCFIPAVLSSTKSAGEPHQGGRPTACRTARTVLRPKPA